MAPKRTDTTTAIQHTLYFFIYLHKGSTYLEYTFDGEIINQHKVSSQHFVVIASLTSTRITFK